MNKVIPGKEKNGKGVSFKCCSLNFENDLVVFVCICKYSFGNCIIRNANVNV